MRIRIEKICVPTDFSERADHAVHYGAALAHHHGAALHILHVLEHTHSLVHHPDFSAHGELALAYFNDLQTAEAEADEDGEAWVSSDTPKNEETHKFLKTLEEGVTQQIDAVGSEWWKELDIQRVVRYGHPVEQICNYANKQGVDLIVMGTHGRSGLSKLLMGSVADRVIKTSPCPVVAIRHPDHAYTVIE